MAVVKINRMYGEKNLITFFEGEWGTCGLFR